MTEKHYVISLRKGYDKQEILDELNYDTTLNSNVDSNTITDRPVDTVNKRDASKRIFEVALTDEEAAMIMNDPRVGGVNEPLVWDPEWEDAVKTGSFERNSTCQNNWGLVRHIVRTNPWTNGNENTDGGDYPYHLDGTGVDYVHQEGSRPRHTHEQWSDGNGGSRIIEYQWGNLPNINQGEISYGSYWGDHPTGCASMAVGNTLGWAPGANFYAMSISEMTFSNWFDAIKEFHKNKPIDPNTGFKRPTVVSASWGYKANFTNVTSAFFRGNAVTFDSTTHANNRQYGFIGDPSLRFNANLYNLNVEVEEMEDEGVIHVKSAGNQSQKLVYSGDPDYNNYITRNVSTGVVSAGNPVYTNRGAGNIGPNTIVVGNIHSDVNTFNKEYPLGSSDKGPRVDVWAAGTNMYTASHGSDTDYRNYSGTSFSTPNVAGMICLLLQLNPGMTPAAVREWVKVNATKNEMTDYTSQVANEFDSDFGLMGAPNNIAYIPFGQDRNYSFSGLPDGITL